VRAPLSPSQWVQRCDRCHGVDGNSKDPRVPALAAQRFDYLEQVLRAYQTGARKSATMAAMADMLNGVDVGALAAYYASQHARPVVYVTLPCQ
jgi:cytochrome c553